MADLTDYEIKVLRDLRGDGFASFGADRNAAQMSLRAKGYISFGVPCLTSKASRLLHALDVGCD